MVIGKGLTFLEEMVESTLQSSTLSAYFDLRDSSQIVHGENVDEFVVEV